MSTQNSYNPLVSIIIPVYNGAEFMSEAIDSALEQTYNNIEIIVVNDGSTDNGDTEKIALEYGNKIRYFYKENGGCASALNYGISQMRGEWFSWLSHDDVYFPEKIEKEINCINEHALNSNNTIIASSSILINKNSEQIFYKSSKYCGFISGTDMYKKLFLNSNLNGCTLLIPKAVIDKVGLFNTAHKYILDWEYWINCCLLDVDFYAIKDALVKNRVHSKQVTVRYSDALYSETIQFIQDLCDKLLSKNCDNDKIKILYFYISSTHFIKNDYHMNSTLFKLKNRISTILTAKEKIYLKKLFLKKAVLTLLKKMYKKIIRKTKKKNRY